MMSTATALKVHAIWDDVARVWVATSDDVPGLATEADDMEALVTKLKSMIPELLDANAIPHGAQVPFEIRGQRFAKADPEAA